MIAATRATMGIPKGATSALFQAISHLTAIKRCQESRMKTDTHTFWRRLNKRCRSATKSSMTLKKKRKRKDSTNQVALLSKMIAR